jgi:S-adenosylmethionine hydrolase
LQEIGASIELEIRRPRSTCTISAEEICGQVVYVDRFGNLVTNISSRDLREFGGGGPLEVFLDGKHACRLLTTYASVNAGSPVAVVGGFDRLEISINADSASKRFGAGFGVPVTVRKELQ